MALPEVKPWIKTLEAYVPGREAAAGSSMAKLSANEAPFGPSEKALAAYAEAAAHLRPYPIHPVVALRETIAGVHGIEADQIICGAGSDEMLALVGQAFVGVGDEVIFCEPGFDMYRVVALSQGATPVPVPNRNYQADIDGILAAVTDRTRVVYLDNPNNPTGTYRTQSEVERLHAGLPEHVVLVLDGAYAESVTADDYEAGIALVRAHQNVVMTRTFSKMYAMAAMRLGWAYGSPLIIDAMNRLRMPFNVSVTAAAAGAAAVEDAEFLDRICTHNAVWRDRMTAALSALGLHVVPSQTNFLLIRFPDEAPFTAGEADAFLAENGILVRSYRKMPEHLRITIGTDQQNNSVLELLSLFMSGQRVNPA